MSYAVTLKRAIFRDDEDSEPDIVIQFNPAKDDFVIISEGEGDKNIVYIHKDSLQALIDICNEIMGDMADVDPGRKD